MPRERASTQESSKRVKKKSSRKVRICPFCRKPTLKVADSISGWMTADIYRCDTCGYRGSAFIEVDPEVLEKAAQASTRGEKGQKK